MAEHRVVGHDAWVEARRKHLAKEKEFTRLRNQLSRERRELPRGAGREGVHVRGRARRADAVRAVRRPQPAGRLPRDVQPRHGRAEHPWTVDAPCFPYSYWMDNFNGVTVNLNHRDITMVAVSRAP